MPAQPVEALLVEDDPVFEGLVRAALQRVLPDLAVRCCRTGADAIALLDDPSVRLTLVLADLGLPDVSGIEVIRIARRRFPDVPILVISTISSERTVLAAIRAGARGYVLKDDSEAGMARAVEQTLAGNYPISPALARYLFRLAGSPELAFGDESVRLSAKETETLRHISRGLTYLETAERMGVALSTVQSHIRNLYRKLDVHSQAEAVTRARSQGLL
ncbi:MAG: hypothetical protein RIS35_136 [Pseudomonadota bacterium]